MRRKGQINVLMAYFNKEEFEIMHELVDEYIIKHQHTFSERDLVIYYNLKISLEEKLNKFKELNKDN